MKRSRSAGLVLIAALFVFACNVPAVVQPTPTGDVVGTLAALTVDARLTQMAPPTFTPGPLPTSTSALLPTVQLPTIPIPTTLPPVTPTSSCNAAKFVADVSILDGTILEPGEAFTKTWRLRNSGTCSWTTAYSAVFSNGTAMGGPASQALAGTVNPGQTVDISINFTAPTTGGDYVAYYKLRDAGGVLFSQMYVQIKVQTGKFAVTRVTFTTSGGCGNFSATANITTNRAGDVTYYWVRSDGATDGTPHAPIEFNSAGTKSVTQTWSTTASGSHWLDIYIDAPNHQQFGRASFSCP